MKVLFASFKHDPLDPDAASGADFQYHAALVRQGFDVRVFGPLGDREWLIERVFRKLGKFLGKKYAKFPVSRARHFGYALTEMDKEWKPDAIVSLFPSALAHYRGTTPCVYRTDTTFQLWQDNYPEFSSIGLQIGIWQEKQALSKSAMVITPSKRTRSSLVRCHGYREDCIRILVNPAALPAEVIPERFDSESRSLGVPLRLLLVGRDFRRKGVDIALDAMRWLHGQSINAELTICGLPGKDEAHVRFVGPFRKSDPNQLREYAALYANAHLLLHPARFDPAPIVPSEAAAFGVPTISNNCGGIATSVAHEVSGIILPENSPAEAYGRVIMDLVRDEHRYRELCIKARARFEMELNWNVAGGRLGAWVREAAAQ